MEYVGVLMLPLLVFGLMLLVLAIMMPYYVYRMNERLGEINEKMTTLVKQTRYVPPVIK